MLELKSCLKDDQTYKCAPVEETIKEIERGLEKLQLSFNYYDKKVSRKINLFWSRVTIPSLNIGTNGKGISRELAKASAYGELVERISSGLFFKKYYVKELANKHVFPKLLSFSRHNYLSGYKKCHQKELLNKMNVETLFERDLPWKGIELDKIKNHELCQNWVDGYSLLRKKSLKIPFTFVEHISGTNGLAAGNTLEEAITQATHEIFERYACIQVLQYKRVIPTIKLESIPSQKAKEIIQRLKKNNIKVLIKDFSLNNQFPCIGIYFYNKNITNTNNQLKKAFRVETFRVASSFSVEEALLRCLSEHLQGKTIKFLKKKNFYDTIWEHFLKKVDQDYHKIIDYMTVFQRYDYCGDLSFLEEGETISYQPTITFKDCLKEIGELKEICKKRKSDLITINLTHPIIQFPVVRVIIPGYSDILPYYRQIIGNSFSFEKIIQNKIFSNYEVENPKKYFQFRWTNKKAFLEQITRDIIKHLKRTNQLTLSTIGPFHQKFNLLKLLAMINYQLGDLEKFSYCSRTLASLENQNRLKYIQLFLFSRFKLEELLKQKIQSFSALFDNLFTNNLKNPFVNWSSDCSSSTKSRYILDFNKLIESFYLK
jgi:YcaO-like protein with predicted kinase domain